MFLLKNSDLCRPEIQSFLSKYIRTLSDADLQQLRLHLPNVGAVHKLDTVFEPTYKGLQGLARKRGLGADPPAIYLARAYLRAMLHLQADPTSFYHVESGWFLSLAAKLAQRSVFVKQPNSTAKVFSHNESNFWFGELENAVFLGIMCRLLSLVSAEDPFIYKKHWLSIEEAWRSNNNRACTCWDKGRYALPHEEYFSTIKPALMSTQYSGKEVTLLKVLDTIDALPSSGNFKLGDLYTARVNTAWNVKRRVFENLHFTPTLLQIIEEDLPRLTLQKILQCAE
ncbi:hypothetical protein V8F06_010462 [Rhypophila decipiens]